jgi:hypothetical protein
MLLSIQLFAQSSQKKIQVAILFDTSNSMDGLIDQAKSRIWTIINALTTLRYQGEIPVFEIALYDYGNSSISKDVDYVRQINSFTTDLDLLSKNLFSLTTNGGLEYCGAVIQQAMNDLPWTNSPTDIRLIYIAGNEPFNQGKISYKEVCATATLRDIQVNTIYCGDYEQGIREFWFDGAKIGNGEYSNINSNLQVKHYDTPYDDEISRYNDSLNRTYMGYGNQGRMMKENQISQDKNAEKMSKSTKVERAAVKSKAAYNNASWDVIDAVEEKSISLSTLSDADLPEELQGKSEEEKKEIIEQKSKDRKMYQESIADLSKKRSEFIEKKKLEDSENPSSDFGSEILKSIEKSAEKKGYSKVIE